MKGTRPATAILMVLCFVVLCAHAQQSTEPLHVQIGPIARIPLGETAILSVFFSNSAPVSVTANLRLAFSSNLNQPVSPGVTSNVNDPISGQYTVNANRTLEITRYVHGSALGAAAVQITQSINSGPPQTNEFILAEVLPLDPAATVRFKGSIFDAVYNKATDRLFFLRLGPGGSFLEMYDPRDAHRETIAPNSFEQPGRLATGLDSTLYALYGVPNLRTFWYRTFDAETFQPSGTLSANNSASDIEVSPINSSVLAVLADTASLHTRKETNFYFAPASRYYRQIEITEDGARLYGVRTDCSLDEYELRNGIEPVLVNSFPGISCADLQSANQRLYFDDGTVFDIATGQKLTANLFGLNPVQVAVESADTLNALVLSNGFSFLHRVRSADFQSFQKITVDPLTNAVNLISMGSQWAAVHAQREVVVVPLSVQTDIPALRLDRSSSNTVAVSFPTRADRRYQVQASTDLRSWTSAETLVGTGSEWSGSFDIGTNAVFYRLLLE